LSIAISAGFANLYSAINNLCLNTTINPEVQNTLVINKISCIRELAAQAVTILITLITEGIDSGTVLRTLSALVLAETNVTRNTSPICGILLIAVRECFPLTHSMLVLFPAFLALFAF
jgi:hypothetical protein